MKTSRRDVKLYRMSMTALLSAVICVVAPMAIPIGPVPITLATLAMYLAVYLLGAKWGTMSCLVYVLIGTAGVPVFAGFTGGAGKLVGPTGGYIVVYVVMALIAGRVIEADQRRAVQFVGLITGTAVCYALGTIWYCFSMQCGVVAALGLCVLPFIPGDLVKIGAAMVVGPMLRDRLTRAGFLQ